MSRQLCLLLAVMITTALAGCIPATMTVVPRASGRVVDMSGAPIAGATIKIARLDEKSREVTADREGRFQRGEERRWILAIPLPVHGLGRVFTATAFHQGMQSDPKRFGGDVLMQQFLGLTNPSRAFDLGDLIVHERNPTTEDTGDAVVLQVVFDDMLSMEKSDSFSEWHRDQSRPVYVYKNPRWRPNVNQILSRNDEKKWNALTKNQLEAATEAANDVIARAGKGDVLPEFRSTSGRVRVYEDAGAATQPTPGDFPGWRASTVLPPGYSRDGRYALVYLGFPWSIHSGAVTYVIERTDDGWKILLRDFVYYF